MDNEIDFLDDNNIKFISNLTDITQSCIDGKIKTIDSPALTKRAFALMNNFMLINAIEKIDMLKENMNQKVNENVPEVDNDEFTRMVKGLEARQQQNKNSLAQQ